MNTKRTWIKSFNSTISYILLGITEALAPTSHKAKQEKLFNLILTMVSQPSSSFLGIETSNLSFSSLAVMRALVICFVKTIYSVLVWGVFGHSLQKTNNI